MKLRCGILAILLMICLTANVFGQMEFPETPAPGQLIQDYAGIISEEDKQTIRKIQSQAYDQFNTAIAVVTISSKAEFKASRQGIERVAHDLFNHWQIGKRDKNDNLINQGILLLVSVGDRKARIELGDDWGPAWDKHSDEIMQRSIVKRFKSGDYSGGILAGVKKLAAMGKAGPDAAPSFSFSTSLFENMDEPINEVSPIPKVWGYLGIGVGFLLVLLGLAAPEFRTPLIVVGLLIISVIVFFKIFIWGVLIIFGMMGAGKSSSGGGGGWSGGGGFSSGGFSGGGGATGSW